jgi:hypothetical protein
LLQSVTVKGKAGIFMGCGPYWSLFSNVSDDRPNRALRRHCEELLRRSSPFFVMPRDGLLRFARNDGLSVLGIERPHPLQIVRVPGSNPVAAKGGETRGVVGLTHGFLPWGKLGQ